MQSIKKKTERQGDFDVSFQHNNARKVITVSDWIIVTTFKPKSLLSTFRFDTLTLPCLILLSFSKENV